MPISVVTSSPHRGEAGSGVRAPRGEAQGVTQHWIVFVIGPHPFVGDARPPIGRLSSPFGRGILVRNPWPMLHPRDGQGPQ